MLLGRNFMEFRNKEAVEGRNWSKSNVDEVENRMEAESNPL